MSGPGLGSSCIPKPGTAQCQLLQGGDKAWHCECRCEHLLSRQLPELPAHVECYKLCFSAPSICEQRQLRLNTSHDMASVMADKTGDWA